MTSNCDISQDEKVAEPRSREPAPAPPLGRTTAQGFLWLTVQTLGAKLTGMLAQVALGWFLAPEDFGQIGLAYTVTAFVSVIQQGGLREILVQRQKHFSRWATPVFWMALSLAVLSSLVILVAAPFAALAYKSPQVGKLLAVMAIFPLLNALSVVPDARLQSQLRFPLLSIIGLSTNILTMSLSVLLAWWGSGAYAFVLPQLVVLPLRAGAFWLLGRPPVRCRLQLRRWRFLVPDTSAILLAFLVSAVIWQGDYIILGVLYPKPVVGLYYFAFALSLQTVMLLCTNMWTLLFPAFCKLKQEPERQRAGFLRAVRLLALVVTPACMLQAAVAEPAIRLFFPSRWLPAVPILQILSLGMAARAIDWASEALLLSQGQFRSFLRIVGAHACLFAVLVGFGAWRGEAIGTAIGVAACLWIIGPIKTWLATRSLGGTLPETLAIFGRPLLASALVVGPVAMATRLLPAFPGQDLVRFLMIGLTSTVLYALAARWLMPDRWEEAVRAFRQLARRQGHR